MTGSVNDTANCRQSRNKQQAVKGSFKQLGKTGTDKKVTSGQK